MKMLSEPRGMGGILDYIREDPIGVTTSPASLHPPPLTNNVEDDPSISSSWVLLDRTAYIADRRNATSATAFTSYGHAIQATLCAARPPRVSHLCVHCPRLAPSDFGTEPLVLATSEDGLIFFRAAICNSYDCEEQAMQDFFIYQPDGRTTGPPPSLMLIPHPGRSRRLGLSDVGLMRSTHGGDTAQDQQHYVIALLDQADDSTGEEEEGGYYRCELHRYHSKDGEWTTKVLRLGPMAPSPGLGFFHHMTRKVVTLDRSGGGFMGWVDLCQGILLCDVLADDPVLRYVSLPPQLLINKFLLRLTPTTVRDIAVVQGYIKVTHVRPSDNWTVATWSRRINPDCCWEGEWHKDYEREASHISGSLSDLLRPGCVDIGREEATAPPPALLGLSTGHPAIGLDDSDVVFLLAEAHLPEEAFVLAVEMRTGTLQGAHYFSCERMAVMSSYIYTQSRIYI